MKSSVRCAMGLSLALLGPGMASGSMNFTLYSQPIELRYGEVYNQMQTGGTFADHMFPQEVIERYQSGEREMAITGFTVDMVRRTANGSESQVLLSDHYLHHYILYFGEIKDMHVLAEVTQNDKHAQHMLTGCHGMNGRGLRMLKHHLKDSAADGADRSLQGVSFGSAAGAEYRHNPQRFEHPYRLVLRKPAAWFPTFHVINTKDDNRTVSPLLECPCTPQRQIDPAAGTIDGAKPNPPFGCSPAFEKTGNPSCELSTYKGGWRCCEHHMFLIDTDKECTLPGCAEKPLDQVFMKFTFEYEDATSETRNIETGNCCDTTADESGRGNIEHDVPACAPGTPPDQCIFVTENVQPVGFWGGYDDHNASDLVDLVQAAPHLHFAGLSMELYDNETNELLCSVHRTPDSSAGLMYGTGDEPGNEKGYLVGLTPCYWSGSSPKRFRRDHLLRARSVYDATYSHTGVMSLWLNEVAAVPSKLTEEVLV